MRKADPWWRELRPERHDQEYRESLKAFDNLVEEFPRGRIEPMCILEHNQYRSAGGEPFKLRGRRSLGLVPARNSNGGPPSRRKLWRGLR
jgi:hypothetical protein